MNLKDIQAPVRPDLQLTTRILKDKFSAYRGTIRHILGKSPINEGKLIRPTLLFLLARLRDAYDPKLPAIAAEIEIIHLSSLIHDDVMDNSELRRGQKTLNRNVGNYLSVLWGDFLFIHAFLEINRKEIPELTEIAISSASLMIEGQILEYDNQHNLNTTAETYYRIIEKKTGALFAGLAKISSLFNGTLPADSQDFYDFGMNFGVMFQIADDLIDIFSSASGKDRFRDFTEGKITLPLLLLLKSSHGARAGQLLKNREFLEISALMEKADIKHQIQEIINVYKKRCLLFLKTFPESRAAESIKELIEFVVNRDY